MEDLDKVIGLIDKYTPEPNSGCWLWDGTITTAGYGQFKLGGRVYLAHRVYYQLYKGDIDDKLELDHLCRVRCCVNPDHLEEVTHRENIRRGNTGKITGARMLAKTHCPSGHEYTDENTRIWTNSRGNTQRICIQCNKDRSKKYKNRMRSLL